VWEEVQVDGNGREKSERILDLVACMQLSAAGVWAQQPATKAPTEARSASDCVQFPEMQKQLDWEARRPKDWAELDHYRAANAALAPAKDEVRVVFMGDSITGMWQLSKSGVFFLGKPYVWTGALADRPRRRWY
jgi:hypothetical protein